MKQERYERHLREGTLTFGHPLEPEQFATDENLSLAALDNQLRSEQAERDPWTMTTDKLADKLPGMGIAALQLPDPTYAWKHREEDEEILKAEQTAFKEANPE